MRKNINKLVAVAIGVSIMSGSAMPVFATDTTATTTNTSATTVTTTQNTSASTVASVQAQTIVKPVLTLDDAIKAASGNSETLKLSDKEINYEEKFNDINEKIDDFNGVSGNQEDFNEDSRDLKLKQLKQQRDFDEDMLIQKTTKAYNNIVTSQKKLDKEGKELEIKIKELNDTKLKKNLGLETSIGLKEKEVEIEKLKNDQKLNENKLKDSQYSFKVLTDKDVTKYTLEQDIEYAEFKIDGSVDEYLDNVIDKYLKYSEQIIKLNKDYLNDNEVKELTDADKPTDSKPSQADYADVPTYVNALDSYKQKRDAYDKKLLARLTYLNSKIGIYRKEIEIKETKKAVKEELRSCYTDLLAKGNTINSLRKEVEIKNKQLSNEKLRYDLGLITKSAYNTSINKNGESDLDLRKDIEEYNDLKEKIQKPWIMSASQSASQK